MSALGLPAQILALFGPRPPVEPLPQSKEVKRRIIPLTGVSDYKGEFEDHPPPKRKKYITPLAQKINSMRKKFETHEKKIEELRREYNPHADENVIGSDPMKTLYVARISYDTSEKKLRREFEQYGGIKRLKMVYDKSGKPRGYCFIEFEDERDVRTAYKQADGKKVDGRRLMVDVERGRTVEGWYPRRLGGGRGSGRKLRGEKARALMDLVYNRKDKDRRDRDRRDRDRRDRREGGGERREGGGERREGGGERREGGGERREGGGERREGGGERRRDDREYDRKRRRSEERRDEKRRRV